MKTQDYKFKKNIKKKFQTIIEKSASKISLTLS